MRLYKLDYIGVFVNKKYFLFLCVFGLALSLKVRRVYEVFEITAPFVIFVKGFPIVAYALKL